VLLITPTGERVLDLSLAPAAPRVPADINAHRQRVIDTRAPALSDVFETAAAHDKVVEVAVPVLIDGQLRYILSATLELSRLEALLLDQIEPGGVAALVDRQRMIVARSRGGRDYIGKPPVPALYQAIGAAPRGWSRFVAFEGDAVYTAWAPVRGYGWTVALGIPAASIEQALLRSLAFLAGLALLVIAVSGWLALGAARRAVAGVTAAAVAAQDVAAGRPVRMSATGIDELDALGEALRAAGARLGHEAQVRSLAERERNALLEREREARVSAQAESRAKDEFLAMLGHELRNPLAAIAAAAQVLQRVPRDSPEARRALEIIARQSGHQGRLLDDLLDVARVMIGKIKLDRVPLDLAQCTRGALGSLEAAGRTVEHSLEADLRSVWVNGDAARLEQVVANLVGNAVKFTPPGNLIRVRVGPEGEHAVIQVEDGGTGIAPDLMPRIFDLFAQGEQDRARAAGGLGVGLTLVRRLAELHDGSVAAHSDGVGCGARFTVRLPALSAPGERRGGNPQPRRGASQRVLVVEDNEDVRDMLQVALAADGHQVEVAGDGVQAMAAAARRPPEVAIIDIGLPGMDGCTLARALRAGHGAGLRLIALTGYGLDEDLRRSADAGFEAHLVKPVDLARLAELLAVGAAPREDAAA
jgi:signal transduction histidine kinase/ActR/RegA family two-component response regulator